MRKPLRLIPALGAVLFAVLGIAACGGVPSNAVVSINGTPISDTAFKHWMTVAASSSATTAGEKPAVPEPPKYTACVAHLAATQAKAAKGAKAPTTEQLRAQCAEQYKSLQTEVLNYLISLQWVYGEAEHLGVKVSDAEVHKEFEKIRTAEFPKPAEFEKFLQTSGQTVSDLLLRVKLNMLSSRIQKKVVKDQSKPTEAQITKYYNENKSHYGTPEKRSVRIILTKTEAEAKKAREEVEKTKNFAAVAKKDSTDPTSKANGGLLTEVVKGEEEKALDEAIFAAKVHVIGGPVKTPFGYYVYVVESVKAGTQQQLSAVKATIKQQLISTNEQKALSTFVKDFKKNWQSKTECRSGYDVADCKGYKAPKSTTGATGATGATGTTAE